MVKIEHIGIAVRSLEEAIPVYERLLNANCYKKESVESENVVTAFFRQGESKIELLESSIIGGVIDRFLEKRGEGLHHIAFLVSDLEVEIERLTSQGFQVLGVPKAGADNKIVCFLHPKTTHGVLIELCQERADG